MGAGESSTCEMRESGDACTISYLGIMRDKQDKDIPYQESAGDHDHNSTVLV